MLLVPVLAEVLGPFKFVHVLRDGRDGGHGGHRGGHFDVRGGATL